MRCVGVRPIEGAQGTLLQCPFDVFHALLGSKTWAQSQRLHHVDGDFTHLHMEDFMKPSHSVQIRLVEPLSFFFPKLLDGFCTICLPSGKLT